MIISSPIQNSESVKTHRTSMSAGSISPKRLSRTLFHLNSTRQHHHHHHHLRYRINKTSSTSMSSSLINSQTPCHHRLLSIRQRRLRSKLERLNQTRNFYSRRTEPSPQTNASLLTTPTTKRNRSNNTTVYRPSFKVEKLLNDSRGMKKYLIDYDCLLEQPSLKKQQQSAVVVDQLMYDFDIDGRLPYSNRCSSGYLSDC